MFEKAINTISRAVWGGDWIGKETTDNFWIETDGRIRSTSRAVCE